jgi:hypothetical protein
MAADTLIDTNVLLRLLQPEHPQYPMAAATAELRRQGVDLCIAPQNLVEFWVVATRPVAINGLGMSPLTIAGELRALDGLFRLLEGKIRSGGGMGKGLSANIWFWASTRMTPTWLPSCKSTP